jgi:hypothetical protein
VSLDIAVDLHAEAIVALINAAGGHAYQPGVLKALTPLPPHFTEVYVMARPDENGRVGALGGVTPARVMTRSVAQTESSAIKERANVAAALLGVSFAVSGETFGPVRRETSEDAIEDAGDGYWSGTSSWIYA